MLGHCIDYNKVCKIETTQAEVAQAVGANECTLHIRPENAEDVLTHFWTDNFDMDVETPHGKGSIHSTHMIAFQEKSESSVMYSKAVNIHRGRKHSIDYLSPKDDMTLCKSKTRTSFKFYRFSTKLVIRHHKCNGLFFLFSIRMTNLFGNMHLGRQS